MSVILFSLLSSFPDGAFQCRSLEKGLFKNEVWVGVFGMIAAVASFRSGWKATALPSAPAAAAPAPSAPDGQAEPNSIEQVNQPTSGYDV